MKSPCLGKTQCWVGCTTRCRADAGPNESKVRVVMMCSRGCWVLRCSVVEMDMRSDLPKFPCWGSHKIAV